MQFLQKNIISNKEKIVITIFLILLITLNFSLASEHRDFLYEGAMFSDDLVHIDLANNFGTDSFLNTDYLSTRIYEYSDIELINFNGCLDCPQGSKGPLYYILLGGFFELFSTQQENLFLHASFFNNILSSFFLILFFFFIKKRFGILNAISSSFCISLIPIITYNSVFLRIDPLLHIFIISSLFFLEKQKSHYIIFGIFAGLAHLTHPIGVTLIASYFIYLLVRKEFKGFLIIFCVWISVLSPWLVRNFVIFSDIGKGLYIPFSNKISELFLAIFPNKNNIVLGLDQANRISFDYTGIFQLFVNTERIFFDLYNSEFLFIFIFLLSSISFFSWKGIRTILSYFTVSVFLIFVIYYHLFIFQMGEPLLQLLFIFIMPPIFLFFIYKKKRNLFATKISRFQFFVILYLFIHLIAMYQFSVTSGWESIELRFFSLHVFLFIPLAFFGLQKIISIVFPTNMKKQRITFIIFAFLIVSFIGFTMLDRENSPISVWGFRGWSETSEMKEIHKILKNDDPNKIIASNYPDVSWYKTGMSSVPLPNSITDQESFEKYIEHYNLSYLIFYDNFDARYHTELTPELVLSFPMKNFWYEETKIGNSSVIIISDIFDVDLNDELDQRLFVKRLNLLYENNQVEIIKSYKTYIPNFLEKEDGHKICDMLTFFGLYDDSIIACTIALQQEPTNFTNLSNLIISYGSLGQKEKQFEIIQKYDKLVENLSSKHINKLCTEYQKHIHQLNLYDHPFPGEYFDKIQVISNQDEQLAFVQSLYILQFHLNVLTMDCDMSYNLGEIDELISKYEYFIKTYYDYFHLLHETNQENIINEKKKILLSLLDEKISILTGHGEMNKVYHAYLAKNQLDNSDPNTWIKMAEFNEDKQINIAIIYYENALKFDPDNDYVIEKIEILKKKIDK